MASIIIMTLVIPVEYHNISLMVVLNAMLALPVKILSRSGRVERIHVDCLSIRPAVLA